MTQLVEIDKSSIHTYDKCECANTVAIGSVSAFDFRELKLAVNLAKYGTRKCTGVVAKSIKGILHEQ